MWWEFSRIDFASSRRRTAIASGLGVRVRVRVRVMEEFGLGFRVGVTV